MPYDRPCVLTKIDVAVEEKNNKLMSSEGMEATEKEILEAFDAEDGNEDGADPLDA